VVGIDQEDMLFGGAAEQSDPKDGTSLEVEGSLSLIPNEPEELGRAHVRDRSRGEFDRHPGGDALNRLPLLRDEGAPERSMPVDEALKGAVQRRHVDQGADPHCQIDVVGGALGVQLVEEPERALAAGEGMLDARRKVYGSARLTAGWDRFVASRRRPWHASLLPKRTA
jgi:hypothetical protein